MNAAPIAAGDWRTFIAESYSRYREDDDELTFEDRLFAAGENRNMASALSRFARELHVSDSTAQAYAAVLIEAVKHRESCSARDCAFRPGSRLYDLSASVGMREQSGGLLASVVAVVDGADRFSTRGVSPSARIRPLNAKSPRPVKITTPAMINNRLRSLRNLDPAAMRSTIPTDYRVRCSCEAADLFSLKIFPD